ncbi:hypothetical protein EST38_g9907 [Candolleomyces aberdarensis]|uniref:Uncharacterized protein n=1 Tax=Candolleomyces aberdarensis TaxID=2316362 RepID=A0A4Q2D9F7_9AGAR|nr:hypothetical protein EST38_g9907 [Candolleomyces aberdarensis]
MTPHTRSASRDIEDALMTTLDSDFDTRMSATPPPSLPSLAATLLSEHSRSGAPYPLRKRAKRAVVSDGPEDEGTPRRPTALQLELAKYPRRASPVKVTSPSASRSSSGSSTARSASSGSEAGPGTPRRRTSGRNGDMAKTKRRVSTRERIYSPDKGSGPAGRSVSDSSTTALLISPPSFAFTSTPTIPITSAKTTRPDTYTKRKALPAPSSPRKSTSKGYKPLKSPSTPLKSPRARKATTSPSAKAASLGGVGGRWGSSSSASMLSVFARGLKKRIQGKKKKEKLKAKAKEEDAGEMVISPPPSSIGMACTFATTQEDEATWKRRGSVTMVEDGDDEGQEIELDLSQDADTPMSMSDPLPRSPTTGMRLLSIEDPFGTPGARGDVDEDCEMTPGNDSPVSISASMRKAHSRGKAMKVLGYEAFFACK